MDADRNRPLKPGDIVEVRPAEEILETLGEDASVDGLPFMPEMLGYIGRRFTVSRRAEKICDTVSGGMPSSRRMRNAVILDDLRCDGSAHGGCQAACRLYWKESWLRRVEPDSAPGPAESAESDGYERLELQATKMVHALDGSQPEIFRCQATEAVRATEPLSKYDLRQYVREFAFRDVGTLGFMRAVARATGVAIGRRLRLVSHVPLPGEDSPDSTPGDLALRPGEMVEVKSREEISRTLDRNGKTRGLWFDWEMIPHCGRRFRVRDRVDRIIDERTGEMIHITSDCLILEGASCSGCHSAGHLFCPRAIYPFWREAWLRRVDTHVGPDSSGPAPGATAT